MITAPLPTTSDVTNPGHSVGGSTVAHCLRLVGYSLLQLTGKPGNNAMLGNIICPRLAGYSFVHWQPTRAGYAGQYCPRLAGYSFGYWQP